MRRISMAVFNHLHALSLRFHLERQTGGITRDIERGARAVSSLVGYLLFRITPTVLEILMVAGILFVKLDWVFGLITLVTLAAYIGFTITITEPAHSSSCVAPTRSTPRPTAAPSTAC
jgi:ATP-binding cassette subfamily B protein